MKRLSRALPVLLLAGVLLAGCGEAPEQGWLGYAEGEDAYIAAPQAGWLARLAVKRGDTVRNGDALFTLDDTRETAGRAQVEATIAQSTAELKQAQANLDYAQKDMARQGRLVAAHAGTAASYDLARSNYQQAAARIAQIEAQRRAAQATLTDASYLLSQREVIARTHGRVEEIYFREGEYAPAQTPVVAILPPENIFVRFFVPETEFAHVRLGQKVRISCDGCATNITATITFIAQQQEFTPPVIFSAGSREKLVFKLEARAPGGLKLSPGQPVDVRPL